MANEAAVLEEPETVPGDAPGELSQAPDWEQPSISRNAEQTGDLAAAGQTPRSERPGFEAFFEAEYPRLLRALYLVCGTRHEAEELAQDAFVRAFERWALVVRAENRAGYVYRIALNLHRSKLRRAARAARKAIDRPPEPDATEALADRDAIGRALSALSRGQREAVVMVEWLGMTDDEAGALLGISPITVRVRIHRARAVLRPLLREGGDG